jgi:phosphoribosylformylglycinamidine cyclo-ligase
MLRSFNMGIGLILVSSPDDAPRLVESLRQRGESPVVMGEIVAGAAGVTYA